MAIALAQQAIAGNTHNTSYALAVTSTTAGNLVVVTMGWDPKTMAVTGVTDNAGNTYLQATGAATGLTNNNSTDIWYCQNCLSGATSITVTLGGDTEYVHLVVGEYEFSGAAPSSVFGTASHTQTASTQVLGPALTPTNSGQLLVAACYNTNISLTGITAPWTGVVSAVVNDGVAHAYYIDPPASSQQCAFEPINGGSFSWASSAALFLPVATVARNTGCELVF